MVDPNEAAGDPGLQKNLVRSPKILQVSFSYSNTNWLCDIGCVILDKYVTGSVSSLAEWELNKL